MRRRYSHNKPIEPIRIRNRFSYSKPNETTDSDERVAIRSPTINDDDNAYGSINPQDYNDEMIFSQDNVNSSDIEEEEESDNKYNYEEEEEEEDNNENNDEEEEEEGNNDDNNNQVEEERNNDEEERNNDEEERNNDEEERNNEEEEIDQIVEALDENKIPFCNGEFAPYFNNYTTTALFCWLQKHNVSTKAYEDLVDIIHNSQFEPTHVVKNIRRFQSWRKRLPLLPIITKSIKISPKKTPSTSRGSKLSYQLSISEIIWRVLNNPMLMKHIDLPGNLKGLPRQRRSITGEVWLQDEPFLIIMTSQILEKVTILMMFQHQNIPDGSLRISEIIYKCNDRWHVRNVKLSYLHPSDYISIRNPPSSSMPIYKLFLDLYYDDFGTFRNVYHSLGGVYVQFGNMPAHQRKLIKNHFVIGFIPFGGKFDEFMIPFISEMKELEKGKVMTVQGQDAWIIAGLGVVTADLPQGNDITGVLRRRNLKISHETIMSRRDQLCTEYGLRSLPREDNFIEIWKNFEIPKRWSRLPNPITHYNSFMMSDLLRLAMIMPFLLNQFLKESSIKRNETAMIQQRIDAFRKFTSDSYEELQKCLEEEFSILPKVFVNFVNLPNIHVNMHLLMHAKTFGTLINTQVGIKEMRYNTLFAIRHLADGGIDPRFNRSCTGFTNSNFGQLFLNCYISSKLYFQYFIKKRMPKQERDKLLLTLHNFKTELFLSYVDMKFEAALINSSISWYKFASYMIEEENEDHEESYAIIKGIFQHKGNNNKYYAFIVVDWFEDIMVEHSVLKCPLYRLQATGDKWRRIFPITVIDNVQKVHFIHNCNSERCQLPNHDTTNRIWIKNNFYFTAI
ncbi:unnamed protein product [Rhizophagus irregularis]|nr:unnamed protein product [Rhizophagus irregularis]